VSAARRRWKKLPPMRVLVLMHEDLVPPESIKGLSKQEIIPFKTEHDVTTALNKMDHEVLPLGVATDLGVLRNTLGEFRPKITFNILEEFHGVSVYDHNVVGYLELMKRRYSGCNPRGLMLARDKALSKKLLTYHRIPVPEFHVHPLGRRFRVPRAVTYPLFVKSLTEEGSEGIAQASIVTGDDALRERVEFIHRQLGTDAIAERYIEGRELYVAVVGNTRLQTYPIWELRFNKLAEVGAGIATSKVKWDVAYQQKHGIVWEQAKDLPDALAQRINRACKRTYRALNLTGYARIDLRLAEDGRFFVIEANPNPDLAADGELAGSAAASGLSYERLLDRILRLGLSYRAAWAE